MLSLQPKYYTKLMKSKKPQASFDIEQSLTFRISSLYGVLSAGTIQELSGTYGLAFREWRVMAILAKHEPLSASDLVARSPMDKASVSRAVASLVRRSLVVVAQGEADARVKVLRLSPDGWDLYQRVAPRSVARQKALLSALTTAERESLYFMLDRIEKEAIRYFSKIQQ
jgi:DNA-binding MarR family transcriptional regulator